MQKKLSRSEAARINGAKSKGPVTVLGKERSKRNALKHGLQAKALVISLEDQAEYDELEAGFFQRFQPVDRPEVTLVDQMVAAKWRLDRALILETTLLNDSLTKTEEDLQELDDPTPEDHLLLAWRRVRDVSLPNLQRLISSLNREIHNAIRDLERLRNSFPTPPLQPVLVSNPKPANQSNANEPKAAPVIPFPSPADVSLGLSDDTHSQPVAASAPPSPPTGPAEMASGTLPRRPCGENRQE